MEAIVAVDQNWAIGCDGALLQPIREDLRRFRELTRDKILIYGRKTLLSFPGAKALPQRRNLLLSRQTPAELAKRHEMDGLEIFPSEKALLDSLSPDERRSAMVIGGDSVYRQFLPLTDKVYVTEIDHAFSRADSFFPKLSEDAAWRVSAAGEWQYDADSGLRFRYVDYERVKADA